MGNLITKKEIHTTSKTLMKWLNKSCLSCFFYLLTLELFKSPDTSTLQLWYKNKNGSYFDPQVNLRVQNTPAKLVNQLVIISGPRTLHDLSCQFGTRGFSKETSWPVILHVQEGFSIKKADFLTAQKSKWKTICIWI